jgi:hypothetical protein
MQQSPLEPHIADLRSFCDPTAVAGGTRYDVNLCRKSYMLMYDFFVETL